MKHYALMNRTFEENALEGIPRVFFQLLMTEAQAAVIFIDIQHYYIHLFANLGEFRRMLEFLGPREVGNMHQPVDTFFHLYKKTEVGHCADNGCMLRAKRIFFRYSRPGIR